MRQLNPTILALLGGVVILLGFLWFFSTNRSSDQDKLSDPQIEQSAQSEASKACSEKSTYDLVKRELFRRAAEVRGKDWPAFEKLSGIAVLRAENPVLEGEESGGLNCSATFYLDLPPGFAVTNGSRILMASIDYGLQSDGAIVLRNADTVIAPLATLTRVAESTVPAPVDPLAPLATNSVATETPATRAPPPVGTGRPSFDCANAGSSGEAAVCADSGLAALDANMAAQYRRALASANPMQRQLLQTTGERFLSYRDGCPNRQCMADAYVGRMREIRDIMEGRYRPR